ISHIDRYILDATGNKIQNDLRSICDQIAGCFCAGAVALEFKDPLSYCIREFVRNSFEHAEVDVVHFLIDVNNDNSADLAILDEGIGIPKSLRPAFGVLAP